MLTIPIGPLVMPLAHLLLLIGVVVAWGVGAKVARHSGDNPEATLFNLLLLGVIVARLAFVASHWGDYQGDWRQIVDIRDGGFLAWAGVLAAVAGGLAKGWRCPTLRHPLGWGMASGLVFWLLTSLAVDIYQQGMKLPSITLRDLKSAEVQLADFAGKPMVVNLWATWCPPCRREMPVLAAAQAERPDVAFLFVNQGEGSTAVVEFLDSADLSLSNVLFDNGGQLNRHVGSRALPTTIFYDARGNQVAHHLGELSRATLAHYLAMLSTGDK